MNRTALVGLMALLPAMVSWTPAPVNPFAFPDIPHPMRSFAEVMDVLNNGGSARVVLNYAKCKLQGENGQFEAGPEAIGGTQVIVWEYFAKGVVGNTRAYLSFSDVKLVGRKKRDGTFVFVQNYVKTRFYEDGKLEANAQYVNPTTYEVTMDETFLCDLNNGKSPENGAAFYRVR